MSLSVDETPTVNRCTLILVPKEPFFEWLRSLTEGVGPQLGEPREHNAYLLPEGLGLGSQETYLKKVYREIWELELEMEEEDVLSWPEDRSWEAFKRWFDWHLATMVFDLAKGELVKG